MTIYLCQRPNRGQPHDTKGNPMSTIHSPAPTTGASPTATRAKPNFFRKRGVRLSADSSHRHKMGAVGAVALLVGSLAVLASVAAPTASAMKQECYNHVLAGRYAESIGLYDVASREYAAANACDDGY